MPPNNHYTDAVPTQSNQVSYIKKWGAVQIQVSLPDIPNSIAKYDKGKILFNKKNRNESVSIFNGN